jgi:uncharacterized protein
MLKIKSISIFLVLILGLLSIAVHAVGFDCTKASSSVEKMICSDQELSDLDSKLSNLYGDLTKSAVYPDLKETQRAWILQRNQCNKSECIKKVYQNRIAELSKIQESSTSGLNKEKGKDESESLLSGNWSPGSRAYEGGPGEMQIRGDKISYIDCKQATFSIISSKSREDSLWNGVDKDNETHPYKDIVISLHESPTCKNISNKIMRFLMPAHIAGYASLMLYISEQDYKNEKFNAWGGYHYSN